jgi:putative NADPH-quinone reductase
MKATVILAHPYEKSFNHAIYQTVCHRLDNFGVRVYGHDLYKEEFNPVLTVRELGTDFSEDPLVNQYAHELIESDFIFIIHPNWWGQPPAILKGYIDRVIRPPHAYGLPPGDAGGGIPEGRLKGCRCAVVINTSNTGKEREENYFGYPLDKIWGKCVFGFCGIENYRREIFRIVADSDLELRTHWLSQAEYLVENVIKSIV